jgi:hypothetical protein
VVNRFSSSSSLAHILPIHISLIRSHKIDKCTFSSFKESHNHYCNGQSRASCFNCTILLFPFSVVLFCKLHLPRARVPLLSNPKKRDVPPTTINPRQFNASKTPYLGPDHNPILAKSSALIVSSNRPHKAPKGRKFAIRMWNVASKTGSVAAGAALDTAPIRPTLGGGFTLAFLHLSANCLTRPRS